jgi:hypothetical protein
MKRVNTSVLKGTSITTVLAKASITLDDILAMDSLNEFQCKGIGSKSIHKLMLFRLANKASNNNIDSNDIQKIRYNLTNERTEATLSKPNASKHFVELHRTFLTDNSLDEKLGSVFNSLGGTMPISEALGKLAKAMPHYHGIMNYLDVYGITEVYVSLVSTILNGLIELNIVKLSKRVVSSTHEGKTTYETVVSVIMPGDEHKARALSFGLHNEPGEMPTKYVKAKSGGINIKYGSVQKKYFRKMSSQALEFINLTKDEFFKWAKEESWFKKSDERYPLVLKMAKLEEYWLVYESFVGQAIYLSMRSDYRTRILYDFVNQFMGPHTASGKYMYQSNESELQHAKSLELHMQHAYVIARGSKVNTSTGAKLFLANQEAILNELLNPPVELGFGKALYRKRLAQAIIDTQAGIPTKFLLMIDFTNMGLISNACEFRDPKLAVAANISSNPEPQDSHMVLAHACNVTRDDAKILGQGVYHGQAFEALANSIKDMTGVTFTADQISARLSDELGESIQNIPNISKYVGNLHDNFNSSIPFTTMDGWPAYTLAFIKSQSIKAWGLTNDKTIVAGYTTTKVGMDMPLKLTSTGKTIYSIDRNKPVIKGQKRGAETKKSGGYANIAHSIDGAGMRMILEPVVDAGYAGLQIYDNYIYQGNALVDLVIPGALRMFEVIREKQPYSAALNEMRTRRVGKTAPMLELYYGDAELNPSTENNFFSA